MSAPLYGLFAEFREPEELVEAARAARRDGYEEIEAFSPFPVEGLEQAIGLPRAPITLFALAGGLLGAFGFFALQSWAMVESYAFVIGGRPLFSWPSFVLPSFAAGILGAGVSTVGGMLFLNGLPRLNHPAFDHDRFHLASQDRFFLRIGPGRRGVDEAAARAFLEGQKPLTIRRLPA